jgi:hypothetical protein
LTVFEPSAIELAMIEVDVEAEVVAKRTFLIRHSLQFFEVAAVSRSILFEFDNEQIMPSAIVPSMVNNNIRENAVGRAASIASVYALYELSHLTVAVVFAIGIPSGKPRFHVYGQAVSCGTFVDDVKVERRVFTANVVNCACDYLFKLVVVHIKSLLPLGVLSHAGRGWI